MISIDFRPGRFLLLLPFSGGAVDLRLNGAPFRRTKMRVGAITFIKPSRSLSMRQIEPVELLAVAIDPDHLRTYAEIAAQGRPLVASTLFDITDHGAGGIGVDIRRALVSDPLVAPAYLQALVDALIARMLCRFLGEAERVQKGDTMSPGMLDRVVRHIDGGLDSLLRVDELAALDGLSRFRFSRAYQGMTGDVPGQFIVKRRLCRARELKLSGEPPMADIAARTDF